MLSFPYSPANGQTFKANDLITYKYNSTKNLWVRISGGSEPGATGIQGATGPAGPVSGSDTQLIFNNAGVSGADSSLTFNKTTKVLTTPDIKLNALDNKLYSAQEFSYINILNGANDGIKIFVPSTDMNISGEFTIEAYVKITDITSSMTDFYIEQNCIGQPTGYSYSGDWAFYWDKTNKRLVFMRLGYGYFSSIVATATNSFIPDVTKWYHVAVSRNSSNNYKFFVNGKNLVTSTGDGLAYTLNVSTRDGNIIRTGMWWGGPSVYAGPLGTGVGGLRSLRLVKGIQVYTTDFTPPPIARPLTSTQVANINGSPSAAITGTSTILLIGQSATLIDESSYNRTVTLASVNVDTPSMNTISTAIPTAVEIKYDGEKWQTTDIVVTGTLANKGKITTTGSLYTLTDGTGLVGGSTTQAYVGSFNGTSQYLSATIDSSLLLPTSSTPFTIEGWFYITAAVNGQGVISYQWTNDGGEQQIPFALGFAGLYPCVNSVINTYTQTGLTSPTAVTINKWNHIAAVFDGTTTTLYVNGTSVVSGTVNISNMVVGAAYTGTSLYIGKRWDDYTSPYYSGYISNIRFVIGTAVYTGNFTVPTGPLTSTATANPFGGVNTSAITGTQTSLLTLQSSTITDRSTFAKTITNTGTVTSVLQSNSLFGTGTSGIQGSILYDGTKWQTTEIAVNGNLTSSGFIVGSVSTGISATGTTQTAAKLITADTNIVTTASGSSISVRLPVSIPGMKIYIKNNSAVSINVFPNTGAIINALAANAAYSQAAGTGAFYMASSTTQWYNQ